MLAHKHARIPKHYVWFLENVRERKKIFEENDFLMVGFIMENTKENQI